MNLDSSRYRRLPSAPLLAKNEYQVFCLLKVLPLTILKIKNSKNAAINRPMVII